MSAIQLQSIRRRQCNCCKLGDHCVAYTVFTRSKGDIPGCKPPIQSKTFCEENNVNAQVTDFAEFYSKQTKLYLLGVAHGGIDYDTWWRTTWNYGKLQPVK